MEDTGRTAPPRGIDPGLWSGAAGHHFAHPGNRFWTTLHASGFTGAALSPADERSLVDPRHTDHNPDGVAHLRREILNGHGGRRVALPVMECRPASTTCGFTDAFACDAVSAALGAAENHRCGPPADRAA